MVLAGAAEVAGDGARHRTACHRKYGSRFCAPCVNELRHANAAPRACVGWPVVLLLASRRTRPGYAASAAFPWSPASRS